MDLNLKNKVIIVTGGASGIGRSIVLNLLQGGARVCVLDNNPEGFPEKTFNGVDYSGSLLYITTELTDAEACASAIHQIAEKFKRMDGLVNNAGLNDGVSLENGDLHKFIESIDKNVGHYITMTELTLPFLKETTGTIVNICSKTAETGQGGTSGYAAANGARLSLTEEWSVSFLPYRVRVNAVVVAECWTPQYEWWIGQQAKPEEKLAEICSRIPLGNRMTTTDEIASMVLFLLSEKSSAINGELVHVDGGYVHLDRAIRSFTS
jgi:L-fucose dehydrogenase